MFSLIFKFIERVNINDWRVGASLVAQMVKNLPAMWETWVQSLGWRDPLEKGKATHSSIWACRIPWTEEPCGLQFMGSQRVGHDWVTFTLHVGHYSLHIRIFITILPSPHLSAKKVLFEIQFVCTTSFAISNRENMNSLFSSIGYHL